MEEKRKPPKKRTLPGGREGGREGEKEMRLRGYLSLILNYSFQFLHRGAVSVRAQQAEPQMFLETSSCKIS